MRHIMIMLLVSALLCLGQSCGAPAPTDDDSSSAEDVSQESGESQDSEAGDSQDSQPSDSDPGQNDNEETPNDSGASQEEDDDDGMLDSCPTLQDEFASMTPASYVVVVTLQRSTDPSDTDHLAIGSAFAITSRLLATNAHVALGILDNALPVSQVVAIQAGTGNVIQLTHAYPAPGYTGNPIASPDVALLRLATDAPVTIPLASSTDYEILAVGEQLALTGFPGDVNEVLSITPGITVPQATSLSGTLSAMRRFDPNSEVSSTTTDVIQHQLPTTPGTSGSPLVACGKLVAVNNAGTVNLFVTVDKNGNLSADRQSVAANNFGIHVRHLEALLDQVESSSLPGVSLPPPAPTFQGVYDCVGIDGVSLQQNHTFELVIDSSGNILGTSMWNNGVFAIDGIIDQYGNITMTDNGTLSGFQELNYAGYGSAQTGELAGLYLEGTTELGAWGCIVR